MTSKIKVNRNAEFVEHISSCQPNFLSETRYQLGEGKMKLAIWNLLLCFLKSLLGIKRQKREFVSCLYQSAAVSAAPADFGPPCVSCANTVAAGKGQAVYVCNLAPLPAPWFPVRWYRKEFVGKDNIFDWKHRASKIDGLVIEQQNGLV